MMSFKNGVATLILKMYSEFDNVHFFVFCFLFFFLLKWECYNPPSLQADC